MGWAAGPVILFLFAFVTWYMSLLLADAYRNPQDTGKRNYTYPGAVSAILGGLLSSLCSLLLRHLFLPTAKMPVMHMHRHVPQQGAAVYSPLAPYKRILSCSILWKCIPQSSPL